MRGMQEFKHLSFASTLCGKCTEVCPVKINLHKLLLYNRQDSVKQGMTKKVDQFVMFMYKKAMLNRWLLEKASPGMKNFVLKKYFAKPWGERRKLPEITSKSFNSLWKEQRGTKK
jgi:L-lactate dehydrogenase complex protein LldF